jgi:hypothetical protein
MTVILESPSQLAVLYVSESPCLKQFAACITKIRNEDEHIKFMRVVQRRVMKTQFDRDEGKATFLARSGEAKGTL